MSKTFSKNFLLISFGILLYIFTGTVNANAATEIFPQPLADPAYVYNSDSGIIAIPNHLAEDYPTTLAQGVAGDFLLEHDENKNGTIDEGENLFSHVVKDSNAVLGYAWSERAGWIGFSHGMISGGDKYYPHFNDTQTILNGYLWSKNIGWIQLSSIEDSVTGQENFDGTSQTNTNWGVALSGGNFSGRAWGPALGWIDFSDVDYDTATGKFEGMACIDVNNDGTGDCADDYNKIYFNRVPATPAGLTSGGFEGWGVSKNMTQIIDFYNESTTGCEIITETCLGNNAILTANTDGSAIEINFQNRLSAFKWDHELKDIKVTNRFGQTFEYKNPATNENYLKIKSVVFPLNCTIVEGEFECEQPFVSVSLDKDGAVANGEDENVLSLELRGEESGDPMIFPDSNVATALITLNFSDNVDINQLNGINQNDAIEYTLEGSSVSVSLNDSINLNDTHDGNADGAFKINLTSFAPTMAPNDLLNLVNDVDITIWLDKDATKREQNFLNVTFGDGTKQPVAFSSALSSQIIGLDNVHEGTPKDFSINLSRQGDVDLTNIDLKTIFDGISGGALLEAELNSSTTDTYKNIIELVSNSLSNYTIPATTSPIYSVPVFSATTQIINNIFNGGSSFQSIVMTLRPYFLISGDTLINPNVDLDLITQIAYQIPGSPSGKSTIHTSDSLSLAGQLITSEVDIQGLASGEKIHDLVEGGTSINISGNISFTEISEEIRKNVANLTRNETEVDLTTNPVISSWAPGAQINDGKTLFYEGNGDLIIDGLAVGDNEGSIIVIGGDVYIKSNIAYGGTGNGSFGLIVIKDANGNGGNVYVDPSVTNLVGGYYAEGSLMSARDAGTDGIQEDEIFDGFTTSKIALANQLFVNGSLISRNTIGGSRQSPVEYPEGSSHESCAENNLAQTQKCAERFDINYMRNFAVNGNGDVLNGGQTSSNAGSNSAFVIKYDSRIQTNTPPGFEMQADMDFEEVVL